MNTLKRYAGLLNEEAPENHFLAYITSNERDMLVNAGGVKTPTSSGIFAYPPLGEKGTSPGTTTSGGSAYSGGNNNGGAGSQFTSGGNISPGTDVRGNVRDDNPYTGNNNDDIDSTYTSTSFEITPKKSKIDQIKEFFSGGGVIGNIAKGVEPMSKAIQSKAMTWSLNRKIKSRMANLDLNNPNTMKDPKIVSLQKDLQSVKDGTFTQRDYTAKYGSGDATNPLDASFNPSTLNDNDRQELENLFAPELSYAIGDTTPQNSIVNEYFANMNNQNLGINSAYMDTYNKAKADLAKTMNMTPNTNQYGYSGTMTASNIFYDYLKEQGLL